MTNTSVLPSLPPTSRRIAALDVVRGLAIFGTLGTNIWLFSHPWGLLGMLSAPVTPETSTAAGTLQLALMALTQGKFLALLTLMFGAGLAIQHATSRRRERRWPGRYLWRATLLFVDGAVNYVLIAEFDVLMGYAVTGAIVAWLLLTRPRAQRAMIAVFGALHVVLVTAIVVFIATTPGASGDLPLPAGPSPYSARSFLGLAAFRLENVAVFRAEPVLIGFLTLGMFLAGAHLFQAGVFGESGDRLRRRLMLIGACALPVDLLLGIVGGTAGLLAERYLAAPLVALGILGATVELCRRSGTDGWIASRLREVGKVALSAYLLQNLLGGMIFYGWGLGLAESTTPWRVPVTVVAFVVIAALVTGFAHLWLRRFALGPAEWLWKRGAELGTKCDGGDRRPITRRGDVNETERRTVENAQSGSSRPWATGRWIVFGGAALWLLSLIVMVSRSPSGTVVSSDPGAPSVAHWVTLLPLAVGIGLTLILPKPSSGRPAAIASARPFRVTTATLVGLAVMFPLAVATAPLTGEDYVLGKAVLLMLVPAIVLLVVRGSVSIAWRKDSARWWAPAVVIVVWTLLSQVAPWNPVFDPAGIDAAFLVTAAIATAITAGVGEELFYRRWLQTRLEAAVGSWPGIVLASLAFALMHLGSHGTGQPIVDVARVILIQGSFGVFVGVLWWRYRNLTAIILVHVISNGWGVAAALL